jgi:predicted SAM-dependent methyltransferase
MEGVDDKIDITTMDRYPTAHFDALVCSHVLEHVRDDRAAIAELYRILKPGGWGIIMVPIELELEEIREDPAVTSEADRWRLFGQNDHVRIYSQAGFVSRLEDGGFEVQLLSATALGGSKRLQRCGIADKSVLYISEKQIACGDGVCRRNKSMAESRERGNP